MDEATETRVCQQTSHEFDEADRVAIRAAVVGAEDDGQDDAVEALARATERC